MKNRTLLFGEGLFETFRIYPGKNLVFVEDHLHRMAEGCRFFALPFPKDQALAALESALDEVPAHVEARLRLSLICHGYESTAKVTFETTWEPLKEMRVQQDRGVKLGLAPFQRFSKSPLVRFKTTSYLENIFVFTWARSQGCFDALFTNERGEITEGCITNVFFLRQGHLLTPPAEAGLLPGITRKQIIGAAQGQGLSVTESTVRPADLRAFDGVFVTNSVIEVLPVCAVGHTRFAISKMIRSIQAAYRHRVTASFE